MKFFDFGVEFFFGLYQSGYGASVLLMKKPATARAQWGKKSFLPKKSSIFIFSIFDFWAVMWGVYKRAHCATFLLMKKIATTQLGKKILFYQARA
jgi:hypothetical protein